MRVLVVGAGLAGAVCAQQFHQAGHSVRVIDQRPHVAGNCHTARDEQTHIMEHIYGPHIFNTSIPRVWAYANKFGEWEPYINRVKATTNSGVYSLPINLHTINQFFHTSYSPAEARRFIDSLGEKQYSAAENFEQQAKYLLGSALYNEFFYFYTKKQWGVEPSELPASILKRLPVRFDYDDNYYNSTWQALPRHGYTKFVSNILEGIQVELGFAYHEALRSSNDLVIYTGSIDQFYNYEFGRLGYRTVFWEKTYGDGSMQGCAVMNYCSDEVPYTRRHEHKYFSPWENHKDSILLTEFSKETSPADVPFYPKRLGPDLEILKKYEDLAKMDTGVAFCGRLGTYRYMNMDLVIDQALSLSQELLKAHQ